MKQDAAVGWLTECTFNCLNANLMDELLFVLRI